MAEERLQRRLAAIPSADVVGYSRLMGIDEAGTLARLKALRRDLIDPNIATHLGRIVKLMGDARRNCGITFHCGETCPRALESPEDRFGAGSGSRFRNRAVKPAERCLCSTYSLACEKTF